MKKKTILLALVSALLLSGSLSVVSALKVERPNHIILAMMGEPETVDPAWTYDAASQELIFNVYDTLIFFGVDRTLPPEEQGKTDVFVPSLATEWSVEDVNETDSDTGLTWVQRYTFKIREGVKFHNSAPLTTEDVEYSFERWMVQCRSGGPAWMMLEPTLGFYRVGLDKPTPNATLNALMIAHAVESNCTHVWFNLVMPYAPFLCVIAQSWAGVLNRDWCIAQGDWPGTWGPPLDAGANWTSWNDPYISPLDSPTNVMCGTGPYKFDYWTKGVEWSIVRNVDYWQGWPASGSGNGYPAGWIDRATVKNIPEWSTRKMMFLAGEVDFCYVPRMHIPELILNWPEESEKYLPGIRCDKDLPTLTLEAMLFNFDIDTESPWLGPGFDPANPYVIAEDRIPINFFSDVNVRKGFTYAFDYDTYIREVYLGEAARCDSCIVEGLPYHNPAQEGYIFNLTVAEEHFRRAWGGQVWDKGFAFTVIYRKGQVSRQKAWEMLKTSVESLNPKFHITVKELDWVYQIWPPPWWPPYLTVYILGWFGDYPDPHNFVHAFMHSDGAFAYWQRYSNATVDALVEEGIRTLNETRRKEIYYQLQKIYYEDCPSVPLCQPLERHWQRDWVQGWYYNPVYPGEYFYHLWKGYLGDTDKDYDVDLTDLYNVLRGYGERIEDAMRMYGVPLGTDVDGDGMVDLDDIYWVLINYGC